MQKQNNTFYFILYAVGILLGITLAALATWADYESASYGFARRATTPFHGLNCPIFMTRSETQTVRIKLTNTTEKPISPSLRTEISTRLTADTKLEFFQLAPGESTIVERTIDADNIDLGQFIFVKAGVFSAYPMPDQENTCGVFILSMPGNGTVILILGTMISVALISAGFLLLRKNDLQQKQSNLMLVIGGLAILAMTLAFLGSWIPAMLTIVLVILLSSISLNIAGR
jgi:hypothetical protein